MTDENYENKLKDQELDEKISLIVRKLNRKEPPTDLWFKIVQKIEPVMSQVKKIQGKKSKSLFDWLLNYKGYAIGFTTVCVLVILVIFLILPKRDMIKNHSTDIAQKNDSVSRVINKKDISPEKPGVDLVRFNSSKKGRSSATSTNFAYYEKKIKDLTSAADKKKNNLDPYEKSLYNEKLANLDESISEIKSGLEENGLNKFIQKSLIYAYGEKVNVLLKIINN
jgi:hypothetical protein